MEEWSRTTLTVRLTKAKLPGGFELELAALKSSLALAWHQNLKFPRHDISDAGNTSSKLLKKKADWYIMEKVKS